MKNNIEMYHFINTFLNTHTLSCLETLVWLVYVLSTVNDEFPWSCVFCSIYGSTVSLWGDLQHHSVEVWPGCLLLKQSGIWLQPWINDLAPAYSTAFKHTHTHTPLMLDLLCIFLCNHLPDIIVTPPHKHKYTNYMLFWAGGYESSVC